MIFTLLDALTAATGPDRELDCGMHEVLTGHIDRQPPGLDREWNQQHGKMLLDTGPECLWTVIPEYTHHVEACLPLVPGDLGLRLSMVSDYSWKAAQEDKVLKSIVQLTGMSGRWAASFHAVEKGVTIKLSEFDEALKRYSKPVAHADHRTAALCLSLLLVKRAAGK